MIASQVNGGMIDIHTCPRYVAMMTVAATPSLPLAETLRVTSAELVYERLRVILSVF